MLASLRTSSAVIPASSAAPGPAPRCALRWTSACSMVLAIPCPHMGLPHPFLAILRAAEMAAGPFLGSLADPKFVAAYMIPDNDDRDDDKAYFFFTEKVVEADSKEHTIVSRVARVCVVRCWWHHAGHGRA